MGLFDTLMGRDLPERRDGRRIYFRLLEQSRTKDFFGDGRFADDYDGRIDVITLHMAVMMERLRDDGEDGRLLNQAMFDEMKDDFEVALREEGISDTGVKRRIKPMIGHFYDRLKAYTDAIHEKNSDAALAQSFTFQADDSVDSSQFASDVSTYATQWLADLRTLSLKDIIKTRFFFPAL